MGFPIHFIHKNCDKIKSFEIWAINNLILERKTYGGNTLKNELNLIYLRGPPIPVSIS